MWHLWLGFTWLGFTRRQVHQYRQEQQIDARLLQPDQKTERPHHVQACPAARVVQTESGTAAFSNTMELLVLLAEAVSS